MSAIIPESVTSNVKPDSAERKNAIRRSVKFAVGVSLVVGSITYVRTGRVFPTIGVRL